MSFPKITNQESIVIPELDTFEKILEAEKTFTYWMEGEFRDGGPTPRQIYLFKECAKPWFHMLYGQVNADKDLLIKQYGTFLRSTIINSAKAKYINRKYWKNFDNNFFKKITFYIKLSYINWLETGTETNVIRLGRQMGPQYEKLIKKVLSSSTKFDNSGNIID